MLYLIAWPLRHYHLTDQNGKILLTAKPFESAPTVESCDNMPGIYIYICYNNMYSVCQDAVFIGFPYFSLRGLRGNQEVTQCNMTTGEEPAHGHLRTRTDL